MCIISTIIWLNNTINHLKLKKTSHQAGFDVFGAIFLLWEKLVGNASNPSFYFSCFVAASNLVFPCWEEQN